MGAKSRSGMAFEWREKASKRESYDFGCKNDAERNSSFFATINDEKGSSEDAPRLGRVGI